MLCRWYIVAQGWVVVPRPLKNGVGCMICLFLPSTCKRRGREWEEEGESIAQWQQEKGRDWWNVKFSSAEETGLALLPVIGLAPFPKSKPTTLFLSLPASCSLSLTLTHIHQFPIQSTESPAVLFPLSHHSLSLYPGKADTGTFSALALVAGLVAGHTSWGKSPLNELMKADPVLTHGDIVLISASDCRLNSSSISHFYNPFLKSCPTGLGSEKLDIVECKQHLQPSTGLWDWLLVCRIRKTS